MSIAALNALAEGGRVGCYWGPRIFGIPLDTTYIVESVGEKNRLVSFDGTVFSKYVLLGANRLLH